MTSPLLALFTRSLREETRGRMTYIARGGVAAFTLLLTIGTTIGSQWKGAPGREFFAVVIVLQVICVSIAGLGYFSSAITEEKEEMTLGLLRMTNLNPLSILLGKSTSRLCGALLLLAVMFPFTLLAVSLGGISVQQIVASLLAVGAYTFFVCNLALLASVIAPRTAGAAVMTMLGLLVYFSAGPLIGLAGLLATTRGWLAEKSPLAGTFADVAERLGDATLMRLFDILSTGFAGTIVSWQVISNLALGVVCFLIAWAIFGRFCDRALEGGTEAEPTRLRFFGLRLRRPPRPWENAIAWKEFHFACGGRPGFILRCLGYGIVAGATVISMVAPAWGGVSFGNVGVMILPSLASFAFSIEVAVLAARIIGDERRGQTLSSLASLPLDMRHLLRAKGRGCLLALVPGFIVSSLSTLAVYNVRGVGHALLLQIVTHWCDLLFLVALIAFLSLHMLRGALPLGFVVSIAVGVMIQMVMVSLIFTSNFLAGATSIVTFTMIAPAVSGVLYLGASILFYRRTVAGLELAAGES